MQDCDIAIDLANPEPRRLFTTCVGSHMWGMSLPESDIDLFHAYRIPARVILEGRDYPSTLPQVVRLQDGFEYDEVSWEIGHLVDQLIKGNINAIWFTMTPIIVEGSPALHELREIISASLSKASYRSIRGVAESHLRVAERRPEVRGKALRTAMRTMNFGVHLLREGRLSFEAFTEDASEEDVLRGLRDLEKAWEESTLPERPDEEALRGFLYRLRVEDLSL